MTPRSIRRAAERKAKKLARKAERQTVPQAPEFHGEAVDHIAVDDVPEPIEIAEPDVPISEAKLLANRLNAQKSCGPTSTTGKARSAKNALKTALTGRTVLLPGDDAERYEQHLAAYAKSFRPVGERELELVQALADNAWRLDRIPGLEEAIYIKGFAEFALVVNDDEAALLSEPKTQMETHMRSHMLRMHTYLAYERQFRNLHIQEARLHRQREKLTAEIKQLQKEREQKEALDFANAAKLYLAARKENKSFDPEEFGFEFSTHDLECYLRARHASLVADKIIQDSRRPAQSPRVMAA